MRSLSLLGLVVAFCTVAGTASAADPEGEATVHVTSDRPHTVLFKAVPSSYVLVQDDRRQYIRQEPTFVPVCIAPCTAKTDANGIYRVAGGGTVPSDEFRLPSGTTQETHLDVDGGSTLARAIGSSLVGTGVTFLLLGGILILDGYLSKPDYTDPKYLGEPNYLAHDRDAARYERIAGFVVAPLGVVSLVVGGILVAANHTRVTSGSDRLARSRAPKLALTASGFTF